MIEAALEVYVETLQKRRFKKTDRPRPPREELSADPRHISAQVMRQVHDRDGGCCTYVRENGRRCRARAFREFDHVVPVARGGESTADNLRLRCRAHNQLTAREAFGEEYVSLRASGFRPAPRRSDLLVSERAREAMLSWHRLLKPIVPNEEDLRSKALPGDHPPMTG